MPERKLPMDVEHAINKYGYYSVSHATLRTEDLFDAVCETLDLFGLDTSVLKADFVEHDPDSEDAFWIYEEAFEKLSDVAGDFDLVFRNSEGDASFFALWEEEEEEEEFA